MRQNNSYPIESLLRPIVEWYSAATLAMAGLFCAGQGHLLLLAPALGQFTGGLLGVAAGIRFKQGYRIYRYQRNIKRLPSYILSSKDIPVSAEKLFLGKGFRWQAIHTQRLRDSLAPENSYYLQPSKFYELAKHIRTRAENRPLLKPLAKLLTKDSRLNPVRPLPLVGGNSALHGLETHEELVFMNLSERVGHTLVLGTTRVGKTRLLEILATQDIRRGEVVIVFDPKGDADLLRRLYLEAKAAGREDDLVIFHLGFPEASARYNPISSFARITEVANRTANQLPASGDSAAFKDFAWRFVNIIAEALVALGRRPDYRQIQRHILNIDSLLLDYAKQWLPSVDPAWESAVAIIEKQLDEQKLPLHMRTRSKHLLAIVDHIKHSGFYDAIADGLCSAFNYDKTYFDKITASLLPLLEKLTTGKIADLLSPDYLDINDERPIFDWMQVIRGKKIVYVGLDALADKEVAAAVGSSMFSDLCSVAGQLYKFGVEGGLPTKANSKSHYTITVHADEFNEMANDDVTAILNKGGGAGFQMTLYTQTWSDVEVRLGNSAKAEQVGGNLNTLICLRVLNEKTARYLTDKLPQRVPVHNLMQVSSVTDAADIGTQHDFSSSNEDRVSTAEVPLLTAGDLLTLPKGQAFCLLEGGQLWKIRMPLPKDDFSEIPVHIQQMMQTMRERYQTGAKWWAEEVEHG
jgi:conjugative coupling factor TraD (TOL family)